jgi:hypothetical protein
MGSVRVSAAILSLCALSILLSGTVLEKLSLTDMTAKSTQIVRGRIGSCAGQLRQPIIYTVCQVSVVERWKGSGPAVLEVALPGGFWNGYRQKYAGTPTLRSGEEYVLYLWQGRNGLNQLLGLSQGIFEVKANGEVYRPGITETIVDAAGQRAEAGPIRMKLSELRRQVQGSEAQ